MFLIFTFFLKLMMHEVSSHRISVTRKKTKFSFIKRRLGGAQLPESLTRRIFWKIRISSQRNEIVVVGTKICRMVDFLSVLNTLLSSNYNRNQVKLKNMVFSNFMHKLLAKIRCNDILSVNLMQFTTNSTNIF